MKRKDAAMKKTTVSDGFYLCTFSEYSEKHSNTVTVLVRTQAEGDKRALIIDPAYPEYAEQVKADLQMQGIKPEVIVLSHYHPDHSSGCSVFPHCRIYVHESYENNYDNCQVWEPWYTYLRATHLIRGGDSLSFGDYLLKFHYAPGHSGCSIIIGINDKIFQVGDILMIGADKRQTLPYIADGGSIEEHIKSLELINKLDPDAIIIPHGGLIDSKKRIQDLVEDRVYYLEQVLKSKGELPVEKCLKNDISWYDNLEFHDTNIIHLL
jgi:glyoxylase-like metal-dependent hydrolase (beta-lactamase superfamily II)